MNRKPGGEWDEEVTPSNGLHRGLCLKWVPFSGLRYISKGRDFTN